MDSLTKRIVDHEDYRLYPYKDTMGKISIGIGRNLTDRGIRHDEAMLMFNNDIAESKMELSHYEWFTNMDEVRQGVLIELHFNIGLTKLLKFKNMISFLSQGYYANASNQLMKSLWASQVGKIRANDMAYRLKTGKYGD